MTKTSTTTPTIVETHADPAPSSELDPAGSSPTRRWIVIGALVLSIAVVAISAVALSGSDDEAQTVDVVGPGTADDVLASDGARLIRRPDGIFAELEVPVPEPGSYIYPTADMVPPWAISQPPVSPGASDAPEVFTVWLAAFNESSLCTDGRCDIDDVGVDAPAQGGMYQLDGRVADGDRLRMLGNIRVGQPPMTGAPLARPEHAEVHLLIAPHGRALSGDDGWRQLNGPVGNPTLWWSADFAGLD